MRTQPENRPEKTHAQNMNATLEALRGRKTHLIAALIVLHSAVSYALGDPVNVPQILQALGLSALRAGIANGQLAGVVASLSAPPATSTQSTACPRSAAPPAATLLLAMLCALCLTACRSGTVSYTPGGAVQYSTHSFLDSKHSIKDLQIIHTGTNITTVRLQGLASETSGQSVSTIAEGIAAGVVRGLKTSSGVPSVP